MRIVPPALLDSLVDLTPRATRDNQAKGPVVHEWRTSTCVALDERIEYQVFEYYIGKAHGALRTPSKTFVLRVVGEFSS